MVKPAKNTICLWYDGDAENAARFYAKTFPDSSVGAVQLAPGDFPAFTPVLLLRLPTESIYRLKLVLPEAAHPRNSSFMQIIENCEENDARAR